MAEGLAATFRHHPNDLFVDSHKPGERVDHLQRTCIEARFEFPRHFGRVV